MFPLYPTLTEWYFRVAPLLLKSSFPVMSVTFNSYCVNPNCVLNFGLGIVIKAEETLNCRNCSGIFMHLWLETDAFVPCSGDAFVSLALLRVYAHAFWLNRIRFCGSAMCSCRLRPTRGRLLPHCACAA